MNAELNRTIATRQNGGIRVRSSVKAGLDASSKEAAYCRPTGSSLNHNESMKVRSGVKAGLKTRH
jgi:hypothetical protein